MPFITFNNGYSDKKDIDKIYIDDGKVLTGFTLVLYSVLVFVT